MRDFASTWSNVLKHCISAEIWLIEALVQSALRKELFIALLVERFKIHMKITSRSVLVYQRFNYWVLSVTAFVTID